MPLAPDAIPAILAGGSAEPSHLQALFGDSSLAALERAAAACGIDLGRVLDAYAAARVAAAAANPELDAALAERAAWRRG